MGMLDPIDQISHELTQDDHVKSLVARVQGRGSDVGKSGDSG